jgi:predicted phage terminase large subunit-like protein
LLTDEEILDLEEALRVIDDAQHEAQWKEKLKDRDAEKERLLSDYSYFYQQAWRCVDDNVLLFSWHQQLMCDYLQGLSEGKDVRDLIINLPPGCGKSINSSVIWPAWLWAKNPSERIMACSYDKDLVKKQAIDCKQLIQSEWYQSFFGDLVQINPKVDTQQFFEIQSPSGGGGGWRFSTTPRGKATGRHPSIIIVDDPQNVKQAERPGEREFVIDWWEKTMSSRGAGSGLNRRRLILMQRLHQKDLSGHVLANDTSKRWNHLVLPMEYEPEVAADDIGFGKDPRVEPGELLWPDMFDDEAVREGKRALGADAPGQYQQRPVAKAGGMFRVDRIEEIKEEQVPWGEIRKVKRAWDKAATAGGGCYTAGVLMAYAPKLDKIFILDVVRGQWDVNEVEDRIAMHCRMDENRFRRMDRVTYETVFEQEPGASGVQAARETLRRNRGRSIRAIKAAAKKITRYQPFANSVYAHEVSMLEGDWNYDFIEELRFIPRSEFKDQADSAALAYFELVNKNTLALPDDDMDEEGDTEAYGRLSAGNPDCTNCNRLAADDSNYCCPCCEQAHKQGITMSDENHLGRCNQRHHALYNADLWDPDESIV